MTAALPPQLAPWSAELQRLPGELALGLYPLIARLSSALGALPSAGSSATGEPEGYGGLNRRGPYERLVPSEWLLAFELADEFLRRAASAEHVFFELARRKPSGVRRALVLFDAGPSQLGGPRVVQLAALIVFARRARAAGANFGFGVLQAPAMGFMTELSPTVIERLLRGRSAEPPSTEHAERWRERAGAIARHDDAWLVGGPELRALDPLTNWPRVVLEESLDVLQRVVSAELEHPRRPPVRLALDLPAPAVCVQLLRDPYRTARAAPQRLRFAFDLERPPWFSGDAQRVFAWLQDGGMVAFPVPNSPRAQPGRPRVFRPPPGEMLLAGGSIARRMLALTLEDRALVLYGSASRGDVGHVRSRRPVVLDLGGREAASDPSAWAPGTLFGARGRIHAITAQGELYIVNREETRLEYKGRAIAAAPWPGGMLQVRWRRDVDGAAGLHLSVEIEGDELREAPLHIPFADECDVFLGWCSAGLRCVGMRRSETQIDVALAPGGTARASLRLSPCVEPVGVMIMGHDPSVLVLENDRRTLSLLGRSVSRSYARASAAIAQVAVSLGSPHFAYLTRNGELCVHMVGHDLPVLRILAEAT